MQILTQMGLQYEQMRSNVKGRCDLIFSEGLVMSHGSLLSSSFQSG